VEFPADLGLALSHALRAGDVIVADRLVLEGHRDRLADAIADRRVIAIDATEKQKSYLEAASVIDELVRGGFRRGNRLVALGGGITQDVTAFIASMLFRGVDWLFVPTTLLAQADSCIGSKTSINFAEFKNQLGGFYPPRAIFIDPAFLATLPRREVLSGLGEMAHYFPIDGEEAWRSFAGKLPSALADGSTIVALIRESLEIKRRYVEIDEFDRNERQVFNYGHSFGHALESVTSYGLPHGIAVSYGIDLANLVSVKLGFLDDDVRRTMRNSLSLIWREAPMPAVDLEGFMAALRRDKKNRGDELGLILSRGWGQMFKHFCPLDARMAEWIEEFFHGLRQ
jgi:3-dehydroquinate synthase